MIESRPYNAGHPMKWNERTMPKKRTYELVGFGERLAQIEQLGPKEKHQVLRFIDTVMESGQLKLEEMERKLQSHDQAIADTLNAIRELMKPPEATPKRKIGFAQMDD